MGGDRRLGLFVSVIDFAFQPAQMGEKREREREIDPAVGRRAVVNGQSSSMVSGKMMAVSHAERRNSHHLSRFVNSLAPAHGGTGKQVVVCLEPLRVKRGNDYAGMGFRGLSHFFYMNAQR